MSTVLVIEDRTWSRVVDDPWDFSNFYFLFHVDYQRVFSSILILIIEYLNVNRYNIG